MTVRLKLLSIVYYCPRLHQIACHGDAAVADLFLLARVMDEVASWRLKANKEGGQDYHILMVRHLSSHKKNIKKNCKNVIKKRGSTNTHL